MSWNSRIVGSDMVDPSILCPNPKNWRRHPKHQQDAMTNVFNEIGWIQDIIVNKTTGNIIDGHMRAELAVKNKEKLVPVKYVELTPDEERQALISYDPLSALAEQDNEMLKQLLGDISNNIDMSKFDFGKDVLNSMRPYTDEELNDVPPVPDTPTTKHGDIYHLGNHVLMCGDCTDLTNVNKLMDGKKADMVFTDPPYNVAGESKNFAANCSASMNNLKNSEWDKNFDPERALDVILKNISENTSVYICTSHFLAPKIWEWMKTWASHYSWCAWHKSNPMPSLAKRHWTWDGELIPYATRGKHVFNFPQTGHAPSIWRIPKGKETQHPTEKPTGVPAMAITHSSNKGDIILDPFLGSGSTLIACEQLNRICYGMELSPQYCDVIINRWEKLTGKKAELVSEVD